MKTFIADDGETLHAHVTGNGTPVVLLHGWTSSHAAWAPLVETLAARHRVFRPDARGHGNHPLSITRTPDVARLARDVLNLLDHFGLDKAAVVGHSMGALTLWQFMRDHGCGRLTHAVVIDQSPKLMTDASWTMGIYGSFDHQRSQSFIDELEGDFAESVLRLAAYGRNARARASYERNGRGWQQIREILRRLDPEPLIAIWKSLVTADYRDVLPGIDVPTLLAWGGESNFYTMEIARYLLGAIRTATLSCYESADHSPQIQQPDRFAAEVIAWLAGEPVRPTTCA